MGDLESVIVRLCDVIYFVVRGNFKLYLPELRSVRKLVRPHLDVPVVLSVLFRIIISSVNY